MTSFKTILVLAWPVVIARSSQAVIGFADALMTAPLGEAALAATTTGAMNVFTVTILPMGMVFIAQSFAAQLFGKGRLDVAVRYAWYGLIVAGVMIFVSVLAIPAVGPVLALFGYEPQVQRLMSGYLAYRLLGVGAVVATEALGNWYGGLGNTRLHMLAGLVAMVSNVAFNWLLIGGHLGFPALGVNGAAIASVIASWLGFVVIAAAFLRGLGVDVPSVRPRGLQVRELGRMLRFGLPHGLNWFFEFAAFAIFINVIVAGLGTTALAALMVVMNINSVSFMPAFGVTSAGAILSGQAIGRGAYDEVGGIVRRTLVLTLGWQGSVGLVYWIAPGMLMALFARGSSMSEELVTVGAVMLGLSALWQLSDAAAMTFGETLRAAGDTAWTLGARLVMAWLVFTPAAFVSVRLLGGGHVAALLCVVVYMALLAGVFALRFRSQAWKRIELTSVEPQLV
ncbi:MAG: MATE family efflux transporter [Myxococcota bacterium]